MNEFIKATLKDYKGCTVISRKAMKYINFDGEKMVEANYQERTVNPVEIGEDEAE